MNEPFDDFVAALRDAFFSLRGVTADLLADLDVGVVERGVLLDVERRGPQTVPALAQMRAVSRQAMQKAADKMVERGLLSAEANPRHARSPLLAATSAGRKLLATILGRERRLLERVALPVSGAELRRATGTLRALAKTFATLPGDRR